VVTYIRSAVWGLRRKAQEKELRRIEPEPEPEDQSEYAYRAAEKEGGAGSEVQPDETTKSGGSEGVPEPDTGAEAPEPEDALVT